MVKRVDLSHAIGDGTITYKGLPAPIICDFLSREDSKVNYDGDTSFHIGTIEMCSNTGTYIDSPFHRYADGKDLSELSLDAIAGLAGVKVQISEGVTTIDRSHFTDVDVHGKAVIVQTNWSRYWGQDDYFEGHPFLTECAAQYLLDEGAKLVGIDSYNIDDISDGRRPVHTILLGAEVLIVEHMTNLDTLPKSGFSFYAVPVKVEKFGTFPVRAFAEIDE